MKFVTLFALFLLSACGGADNKSAVVIQTPSDDITKLAAEVDSMKLQISTLQSRIFATELSSPQESVTFDPQDDKTYRPVTGPAGPVLVVMEKLDPYLDGFTVTLRLGNPTSATYAGIKGNVKWGRTFDLYKGGEYNKLSEKNLELTDVLPAGSWTNVKFNIAPAKPDEVRRIIVSPVFSSIRLREASN